MNRLKKGRIFWYSVNILFCLLFIVRVVPVSSAGNVDMDSLKNRLSQIEPDTNKVWLLRDIAYYYQNLDSDSAIHYSQKAIDLAELMQFHNGQIWSLYQKAFAYELKHGIDSALVVYEKTLQIAAYQKDHLSLAKLYNALGVAYYYAGNFHYAVAYYHRSYQLSDSLSYRQGLNQSLNNLGVIYRMQRRYEQALELYSRSLEIKREENDSIGIINTLYNIGLAYSYLGDFEKSLMHLQEAERLSQIVSGANLISMANIQIGIGVAMYNLDDIDEARLLIQKGLDKITHPGNHEWIAALNYLGAIDVKKNNPEEGLAKIKQAHEAAVRLGRLELLRQTLKEKAIAASLVGDHDLAYQSWIEHSLLVDSLTRESKLWAQQEMQARFELTDMLSMIALQQHMLQKGHRNTKRFLAVGSLLTLLLISSSVFIRKGRKKQKELQKSLALNKVALTEDRFKKLQEFNKLLADPLSKREIEVLTALENGLTNKELAEKLFVSEHTIKSHLKNIFIKTEVKNRTELLSKLN